MNTDHVTPAGRSVFYDQFPAERAAELEMRARLLMGLERWLENSRMRQNKVACTPAFIFALCAA